MAITWENLGHAFASGFRDIITGARAVLNWEQQKVQPDAPQIEALTAMVPVYGTAAATVERLAFAALGSLAAIVHTSGGAANAQTKASGVQPEILQSIETLLKQNPTFVSQVQSLITADTIPTPASK